MDVVEMPDGTPTVNYNNPKCAYEVHYDNRLAMGNGNESFKFGDLTVLVFKGSGSLPETLVVIDETNGERYEVLVEEDVRGTICVPHFFGF